jgi:hypothetical protein
MLAASVSMKKIHRSIVFHSIVLRATACRTLQQGDRGDPGPPGPAKRAFGLNRPAGWRDDV